MQTSPINFLMLLRWCRMSEVIVGGKNHTQWTVWRVVCTLLILFERSLMENIKTSVHEEFNIQQPDVFIFCSKHLLEDNKRVQTGQLLSFIILCRNCPRLYEWTNVKSTDQMSFFRILYHLRAEHLQFVYICQIVLILMNQCQLCASCFEVFNILFQNLCKRGLFQSYRGGGGVLRSI